MEYTAAILKNKGVPVIVANLREDDGKWVPVYDAEGEQETEEFHIRFTHNVIADIEELWEGLQEWQEAMEQKPVSTLRRTLALLMVENVDKAGMRMVEGRLADYTSAIGVAWALANGVDPTTASRLLKQATVAVDSQMEILNEELEKSVTEMEETAEETTDE
jgi:predicted PP-loop superfamily ATPase